MGHTANPQQMSIVTPKVTGLRERPHIPRSGNNWNVQLRSVWYPLLSNSVSLADRVPSVVIGRTDLRISSSSFWFWRLQHINALTSVQHTSCFGTETPSRKNLLCNWAGQTAAGATTFSARYNCASFGSRNLRLQQALQGLGWQKCSDDTWKLTFHINLWWLIESSQHNEFNGTTI